MNNLVRSFPVGKSYTKLDPVQASKPYEEYDAKGDLVGYSWYQGETLNLEFNIDGEVVVEADAIIYTAHNDAPTVGTKGYVGQRAYNVVDFKSWTCVVTDDEHGYVWEQDAEFDHDRADAEKSIYVSAKDYLSDKKLEFKILNFRFETVHSEEFDGCTRLIVPITKDLSNKLVKGIYYSTLTVFTDSLRTPIFGAKDCTLLVK